MKKLLIPALAALALVGCKTVNEYREGDVDGLAFLDDTSRNPYHITYDVEKERVTANGVSDTWFWFFSSTDGHHMTPPGFGVGAVRAAKESATYNAVEAANADTLVGALYRYTTTSEYLGIHKSVKCQVTGYPAHVKSIEMTEDRPVLIGKDQQVIRLKNWENLK